jgi:broad specificity phosphatase PhoE
MQCSFLQACKWLMMCATTHAPCATTCVLLAFRFPDGESGSDVYNRVSIFEDHLIRDMKASRFSATTSLCLVTHGLTMRVFMMRWFNWTVESFL